MDCNSLGLAPACAGPPRCPACLLFMVRHEFTGLEFGGLDGWDSIPAEPSSAKSISAESSSADSTAEDPSSVHSRSADSNSTESISAGSSSADSRLADSGSSEANSGTRLRQNRVQGSLSRDPILSLRGPKNGILGPPGRREEVCGFRKSPKILEVGPGGRVHDSHRGFLDPPPNPNFGEMRIPSAGRRDLGLAEWEMAGSVVNSSKVGGSGNTDRAQPPGTV